MKKVFKRTINGLNNQHLFYNVDFIVFVEGGDKQFNKDEVYDGKFNNETEDIIFWKNIFSTFSKYKKYKFKSVGSKKTIKEISFDIVDNKIKSVIVAMDNEFDEILNKRIIHNNIFYTYGYSWENDIWNELVIKNIIEELSAIEIKHRDIDENFTKAIKSLKLAVYADGYLFKKESSFFPRKKSRLEFVNLATEYLPSIKKERIEMKLNEKPLNKSTLYSFGRRYSIETLKYCYGHFIADYSCQLITHYLRNKHSMKTISNKFLYRMGINKFFKNYFNSDNIIYKYYEGQFKRNVA